MINLPKYIGHRGAAGFAPENTLTSMRIAKKCGAQMVEFDVKQTSDNALVIMHDEDIERTTNGHGLVTNMALAELRNLDAGLWFDPTFLDEKVPTLAEIFHVLKELHLLANIEIKPCPGTDVILAQNVVNFIKNYWPQALPPPLVSSFSLESLRTARKQDKHLKLGLLIEKKIPENWKELAQELEVSAICLDHTLVNSVDLTEEMHKNQYRVLTYTVNDLKRAHELYNLGVDSIFTNYPGML